MEFKRELISIVLLGVAASFCVKSASSYNIPEPTIEALSPRGFRVSIPDEPGIQLFGFHSNLNKRIQENETGSISGIVYRVKNGEWTLRDSGTNIQDDDVLHYWIYVQANGKPYVKANLSWSKNRATGSTDRNCIPGTTTVKNDKISCKRELIFEENFNSLNESIWRREVKIPRDPDYEFCVYHIHEETVAIRNGIFQIIPSILEDSYGEGSTSIGSVQLSGCTSNIPDECSRKATSYNILPPVISARLTTKNRFSFRYGKIEIRAKFPEGDWLYPELWLLPRNSRRDNRSPSVRITLGFARGNQRLVKNDDSTEDYGGKRLEFGIRTASEGEIREEKATKMKSTGKWTGNYHVYTTTWSADGFTFHVDDQEVGRLKPGSSGWQQSFDSISEASSSNMAPFDEEFYISLGVGVGGVRQFPERTTSGQYDKPWRNVGAKAMLHFWQAKNQWFPSWNDEYGKKTALEIDYIRIWSL
ncbi:beta-1,3-glucan-binding protein [Orussus abietinus]|uniref:beta-1,3-glucan-binding protein n=1 Tax=Orussus abietinus TaxID=222816 RepID=UPI0006260961|nr:beta-1,3-glucan-binding protein [Orussus abietinus]